MITIATVLRSGGEYLPEHVAAIRDQCAQHAMPHKFVCLTDLHGRLNCETLPLEREWPGWWSKMELFRLPGPVLYFDLDTVIKGSIAHLEAAILNTPFIVLRDFYRGKFTPRAWQSSMMSWNGDQSALYREFADEPRYYLGGDQEWLEQHHVGSYRFWQDVAPGQIGSWKATPRTDDERIIIFHGKPRPWEVGNAAA